MVALSIFGAMGFVDGMFSFVSFISVLLPIIVGMVLGNLDEEMRKFWTKRLHADSVLCICARDGH